ncbi:MAG: rubrerythrin family protein [Spirochaetaceae bacterium]|jgi:rubrerythrin|nr:rubrerythrin family protein [Spirochaetaceae bacterium]
MSKLPGTKTELNLKAAFAGESQARNKYIFFAAKAKEEGFANVARYFEDSAVNEQEHAKLWFKYLDGIRCTADNLKEALSGEENEAGEMYPAFAKVARDEGFEEIANRFEQIANIERTHGEHFKKMLNELGKCAPAKDVWKCDNCGNIINAKSAPNTCPVCGNADIAWSGYKAYKLVQE